MKKDRLLKGVGNNKKFPQKKKIIEKRITFSKLGWEMSVVSMRGRQCLPDNDQNLLQISTAGSQQNQRG